LKVRSLEGRFFGGLAIADASSTTGTGTSNSGTNRDTTNASATDERDWSLKEGDWNMTVGEGMAFQEDHFLTSANLCRWIINYEDIQIGQQVGMGSYGVVYQGKWKGVSVAVKRFIKQKLDERRMLEFRAEMAFLSQLHHPNIVLFIGTCAIHATPPPLPFFCHTSCLFCERRSLFMRQPRMTHFPLSA
jgi:hypothetical protein